METLYCGIDAGSSQCHVAMLDEAGKLGVDAGIPISELQLTALLGPLQKDGEKVRIHLEASELAGWIRGIVMERTNIEDVVVSDPKRMSWIAKDPHKSDHLDAFKLAEYLRIGRTHPVNYTDDKKMCSLKKQVQDQESLSGEKARLKNKIKSSLRKTGIIIKSSEAYSKRRRQEILQSIEDPMSRTNL